jgi:hypothetical protein
MLTGTISSLVTTTELKEHIKETQQLTEAQIRVLKDTIVVDINNLKDKTSEDISDLQHALQSAIASSQKSEAKLTAITDIINLNIDVIKDSLIAHNYGLIGLNDRLKTAFIHLYILGGVVIAETSYLIYKFF